jgi:hypothetical protein
LPPSTQKEPLTCHLTGVSSGVAQLNIKKRYDIVAVPLCVHLTDGGCTGGSGQGAQPSRKTALFARLLGGLSI